MTEPEVDDYAVPARAATANWSIKHSVKPTVDVIITFLVVRNLWVSWLTSFQCPPFSHSTARGCCFVFAFLMYLNYMQLQLTVA